MDNRNDEILSVFNREYSYKEKHLKLDFKEEIIKFSENNYTYHQRAARLSAAVKRYKTSEALNFVINIAISENLDITPLVAKKLMFKLFARKGSQKTLVSLFGQDGRIKKSTTNDTVTIENIVAKYKKDADKLIGINTLFIEQVKTEYKKHKI
ncbi:hypothetical protein [Photobacterium leiognathi]|uniref:hypothetical protein n=1 Tax=Photobacterium leiognathi TaxID=553611 RepID=UPI0029814204|nr:hypothetical protein [Photobacterium leiognathi]